MGPKKNGSVMGRPKLPESEKAVRGAAPFLTPAEWAAFRRKMGLKEKDPLGPAISKALRAFLLSGAVL